MPPTWLNWVLRSTLTECFVKELFWGAMLTLVLRREHVDRQTSMATAEYRRGHGTHIFRFDKALGVDSLHPPVLIGYDRRILFDEHPIME